MKMEQAYIDHEIKRLHKKADRLNKIADKKLEQQFLLGMFSGVFVSCLVVMFIVVGL